MTARPRNWPAPPPAADPAVGLAAVASAARAAGIARAAQVQNARERGWSWQQIADGLGVSRQAVHKKHGGRRLIAQGPLMFERFTQAAREVVMPRTGGSGGARRTTASGTGTCCSACAPAVVYRVARHRSGRPARGGRGGAGGGARRARRSRRSASTSTRVRRSAEESFGPGALAGPHRRRTGDRPFSPRAKRALELSLREALALGDRRIGRKHVLLGLTSVAARWRRASAHRLRHERRRAVRAAVLAARPASGVAQGAGTRSSALATKWTAAASRSVNERMWSQQASGPSGSSNSACSSSGATPRRHRDSRPRSTGPRASARDGRRAVG